MDKKLYAPMSKTVKLVGLDPMETMIHSRFESE